MVLWKMTYYIDKDKQEEYRKFAQEVSIPYWTSVPGMTEMRAYVQNGSTQLLVEMEFESGEGKGARVTLFLPTVEKRVRLLESGALSEEEEEVMVENERTKRAKGRVVEESSEGMRR